MIFVLLFLTIVLAMGGRTLHATLERNPDVLKKITLPNFKSSIQTVNAFFDETAGQDDLLLGPLAKAKNNAFHKLLSRKVIKGQQDWLYLWEESTEINLLAQATGLKRMRPLELLEVRLMYLQRAAWLAQKGIAYYPVLAPNKAEIYPEFLPKGTIVNTPTFVDDIVADITTNTSLPLIDLRQRLLMHKSPTLLYYKSDTHWNSLGAWHAYRQIVDTLIAHGHLVKPYELQDFDIEESSWRKGDLVDLSRLPYEGVDQDFTFSFKGGEPYIDRPELAQKLNIPFSHGIHITTTENGTLPQALFLHDSFGERLYPFLNAHFKQLSSVWLWGYFEEELVLDQQPRLVIDQVIVRNRAFSHRRNPAALINHYWDQHFEGLSPKEYSPKGGNINKLPLWVHQQKATDDQLVIVRVEYTAKESLIWKLWHQYDTSLDYQLKPGKHMLYLQLDPQRPFSMEGGDDPGVRVDKVAIAKYLIN